MSAPDDSVNKKEVSRALLLSQSSAHRTYPFHQHRRARKTQNPLRGNHAVVYHVTTPPSLEGKSEDFTNYKLHIIIESWIITEIEKN